jgi:hypothetical protein
MQESVATQTYSTRACHTPVEGYWQCRGSCVSCVLDMKLSFMSKSWSDTRTRIQEFGEATEEYPTKEVAELGGQST